MKKDVVADGDKKHPEIREGEIFLANCSKEDFQIMTWQTKRQGEIAYDFQGNQLTPLGVYPVFIELKELERAGSRFSIYGPSYP